MYLSVPRTWWQSACFRRVWYRGWGDGLGECGLVWFGGVVWRACSGWWYFLPPIEVEVYKGEGREGRSLSCCRREDEAK
jgi:hypothetical protein